MKMPYMKFYPRDWMGETGLQSLGYAERGLWVDMLCLMATGEKYGYLTLGGEAMTAEEIARMTRGDEKLVRQMLRQMLRQNVYSVCEKTGAIYCRRMVKDAELHEVRSNAGRKGAQATNGSTGEQADPSKSSTESRIQNPESRTHILPGILPRQKSGSELSDLSINPPTLADCQTAAATIGMTGQQVEQYYHARNSQGWVKSNGRPITSLRSDMANWKNREQTFADKPQSTAKPPEVIQVRIKEQAQ